MCLMIPIPIRGNQFTPERFPFVAQHITSCSGTFTISTVIVFSGVSLQLLPSAGVRTKFVQLRNSSQTSWLVTKLQLSISPGGREKDTVFFFNLDGVAAQLLDFLVDLSIGNGYWDPLNLQFCSAKSRNDLRQVDERDTTKMPENANGGSRKTEIF